jgi:hypothetical protein
MTDVIDFLERLGQDATLRGAPLENALNGAGLSSEIREALAKRDQRSLEALLGVGNVCCLVNAPIEEDHKDMPVRKDARAA